MRIKMLSTLASRCTSSESARRGPYLPALKMAIRKSFQNQLDNRASSSKCSPPAHQLGLRPKEACDWLVKI
ncbi:MAG: hypothetical protein ACLUEQ_02615 [Cloacibacillus evryensis]